MAFLLFFTAVLLSGIAAYYSVIGLIAIFSAAALPVAIMGGSLEVAKLVVASWLYRYWNVIPKLMKLYFTSALLILMLITSMGIFGFLSKAHNDQNLVSGEVVSKLAIYDEKIKTSRDNIEANRKALKQLDEAVDQVMARSTSEQGADKAVQIRRQQAKERDRLLKEIVNEQKTIAKLNEEAAPIRADVRAVEAEVGPIKYIAALLYGDNPEDNLLERAVRWLIILLIFVFDPLAVLMLIAANLTQLKNVQPRKEFEVSVEAAKTKSEEPVQEEPIKNDNGQYKIIPDETIVPMAAEATTASGSQSTYTTTVVTSTEPSPAVEKVGVKKKPAKKSIKKSVKPITKKPIKQSAKKPTAKPSKKKITQVPAVKEEVKQETKQEPQAQEQKNEDKSLSVTEQGFIPKPLTMEEQVQSMIEADNQQELEQVYKKIVKELAKKNRSKSTHWGPIKNVKNG